MSRMRVIDPGMLTLIEDGGRYGYGNIGITQSGPADRYSAAWANRLLGNQPDAAVLEITMGGAVFEALGTIRIALTGADARLQINNQSVAHWCTHTLHRGDHLQTGMATEGLRIYLATDGGWGCQTVLGSCATTPRERLGSILRAGVILESRGHPSQTRRVRTSLSRCTPPRQRIDFTPLLRLRMVPTYHHDRFDPLARAHMIAQRFRVTPATDRMGCRLRGSPIASPGEILSEPTACGAVQIPPDGQPIILLNDHQTIGGYPIIGTVIPPDLSRLAQARPGTQIAFTYITLDEALHITAANDPFTSTSQVPR